MEIHGIEQILKNLLLMETETEIVEFKEAKNAYDFSKIGKYFSALSNEANMQGKSCAWLVFGVENKKHVIVGSKYRTNRKDLDSLKGEIADRTTNRITFIEIYEVTHPNGRVIMFQIPPAPRGIPIAFEGHYYGRDGENLAPLNLEEIERIRSQSIERDWSAKIVKDATIKDLDAKALKIAREKFKEKYEKSDFTNEIDSWDDITFLDKAKITIGGKITNTALLLLGKEESIHYLSPVVAEITWKLDMEEKAYEHFYTPFLLTTTEVLERIRNIKVKFYPNNEMRAITVDKYDPRSILEALHNCIAHQDYSKHSRIIITEQIDKLIFSNAGMFFEGNPEDYSFGTKTPEKYRNQWLTMAMVNLGMIDRLGYGIYSLYISQRNRFFPLPDYSLSNTQRVILQMYGQVIDENYTKALIERRDLSLLQVILLDRVQKGKEITDNAAAMLRKESLIEGRKPNYFVSAKIAQSIGQKAAYTKNKAFDKQYYLDLIIRAITQHGSMNRKDIDDLLWKKLPDWMSDEQRKTKIGHLLSELRIKNQIQNTGAFKNAYWILIEQE
jgi:ATP-dependent DNA helicase RecG